MPKDLKHIVTGPTNIIRYAKISIRLKIASSKMALSKMNIIGVKKEQMSISFLCKINYNLFKDYDIRLEVLEEIMEKIV